MSRAMRIARGTLWAAIATAACAAWSSGWDTRAQESGPETGSGSPERGRELYVAGCASCHGDAGAGSAFGPSLQDAGAANADYQLRTGRMPAADPVGQPLRKDPAYDEASIRDLVAYVASLGEGSAIPTFTIDQALLPRGSDLFIANCAPCHGATANGGAVGGGWIAPPLDPATPLVVAEAIVAGPGQMPVFALPQQDLDAIVTYVGWLRTAPTPGGFAIGGIGPVPEGLVAWAFGMALLFIIVILVGREWQHRRRSPPAAEMDR